MKIFLTMVRFRIETKYKRIMTKIIQKLDPKAAFVVSSMTRSDIAFALNSILENEGWETEPFAEDDLRLTDEVCEDFVDGMQQAACDVDELVDREYLYNRSLLANLIGKED